MTRKRRGPKFTHKQCFFLNWTFGSYDWSPGKLSGSDHCRHLTRFLDYGMRNNGHHWSLDEQGTWWTQQTARLFYGLARATCSDDQLYRGDIVSMHRPYPPKHTRESIMRKAREVLHLMGISAIDMLAELVDDRTEASCAF